MENSKFKIGDEVVLLSDITSGWGGDYSNYSVKLVTDLTATGKVIVKSLSYRSDKTFTYNSEELIFSSEAQHKVDELQKEWKTLSASIKQKMEKVHSSFDEAVKLAQDKGFQLRDFDCVDMRSMIESGGWNSSSFAC